MMSPSLRTTVLLSEGSGNEWLEPASVADACSSGGDMHRCVEELKRPLPREQIMLPDIWPVYDAFERGFTWSTKRRRCLFTAISISFLWSHLWVNGLRRVFPTGVVPDTPLRGGTFLLPPYSYRSFGCLEVEAWLGLNHGVHQVYRPRRTSK